MIGDQLTDRPYRQTREAAYTAVKKLIIIMVAAVSLGHGVEIHVGPRGSDSNQGTQPLPEGRHSGDGHTEDGIPAVPSSRIMGNWHEHIYAFTAWNRKAGTGHRILGCDIYDAGAGGILLGGGDRRTLTPGNNLVKNCHIYRVNRWDRTYKAMVNVDGCGNRIEHNYFHDAPGSAIYLHGNDHVIAYNRITHVLTDSSDMGAIYMGRDPSEAGNRMAHNFFQHFSNNHSARFGVQAIFFDDCSIGGASVVGNIFHNAGSNGVIKFNKGGSWDIRDNIFVDCPAPVIGGGDNTHHTLTFMKSGPGQERLLHHVDITKPPYSVRYPRLLAVYQGKEKVVTKPVRSIVTTASDPRFVDGSAGNFSLRGDAEVPEAFQRTDFARIGLYIGDGRESLPGQVDKP